jgi:hypothetical protein
MKIHPYSIIGYTVSAAVLASLFLLETSTSVTEPQPGQVGGIVVGLAGILESESTTPDDPPVVPQSTPAPSSIERAEPSRGDDQLGHGEFASRSADPSASPPQVVLDTSWTSIANLVQRNLAQVVLFTDQGITGYVDPVSGKFHSKVDLSSASSLAICLESVPDWLSRTPRERRNGEQIALLLTNSTQQKLLTAQRDACESAGKSFSDVYSTTIGIQTNSPQPFVVRALR